MGAAYRLGERFALEHECGRTPPAIMSAAERGALACVDDERYDCARPAPPPPPPACRAVWPPSAPLRALHRKSILRGAFVVGAPGASPPFVRSAVKLSGAGPGMQLALGGLCYNGVPGQYGVNYGMVRRASPPPPPPRLSRSRAPAPPWDPGVVPAWSRRGARGGVTRRAAGPQVCPRTCKTCEVYTGPVVEQFFPGAGWCFVS
jgi:hypothetical protein